ncbi:ribulokinase [Vallicoccus soli]|uniref:Ribulokinase n=1 Tax=Vallicoccus soli TaxID=2339232 RepID=A0A3A3YP31_9ACTN|nr:ribulokinase [Vallicoccus soli]RJK92940.1 ribulokinase [Vallicoccus soli]
MNAHPGYVVGVDYGTLSGRAVVVRVSDGAELGTAVHEYAHAVLERALPSGRRLPPDWALQVPQDYVDVLRVAVPKALAASGVPAEEVVGLSTDFTACTVLPVLADGTPLCELPGLEDRPHAYVKLWKHHAAQGQADRINALAHARGERWISRYGGKLSSEWALAKALQLLEEDPELYARTERWVEAADWVVWRLTGEETRNECTAGYKEVYQDGAFPSRDYLRALHPDLVDLFDAKVAGRLLPLGALAGRLTAEAAAWTGLPEGIAVAAGNVDAHVTVPAACAIEPGQLVAIMGTSTCHVMNGEALAEVPGMCGVVHGGITPGLWGYEAGQSGVGDIFGWFVQHGTPPYVHEEAAARGVSVHELLSRQAAEQPVGAHGLVALDWHNGNRSVLVNHELSGLVLGLTTTTQPHEVYRALLEATAFGTRRIVQAFEESGVPVREIVVAGGLLKNAFLLQMYADVTQRPLSVIGSEQGPALGSAIHAAVAAGAYPDVRAASAAMGRVRRAVYVPDEGRAAAYDALYAEYERLHDHFGKADDMMLRLRALRRRAVAQ